MHSTSGETKPLLMEARAVSKRFGARAALEKVSVAIRAGEIITVIGLNGSGKSTLLKVLLGLARPDSGEVWRKAGLRVGYMPQKIIFDPIMPITVEWFLGLSNRLDNAQLKKIAAEVEIAHLLKSPVQALS